MKAKEAENNELSKTLQSIQETANSSSAKVWLHSSVLWRNGLIIIQVSALESELASLNNKIAEAEVDHSLLEESNHELSGKVSSLEAELSDSAARLATLESEKTAISGEVSESKAAADALNTRVRISIHVTVRCLLLTFAFIADGGREYFNAKQGRSFSVTRQTSVIGEDNRRQ